MEVPPKKKKLDNRSSYIFTLSRSPDSINVDFFYFLELLKIVYCWHPKHSSGTEESPVHQAHHNSGHFYMQRISKA